MNQLIEGLGTFFFPLVTVDEKNTPLAEISLDGDYPFRKIKQAYESRQFKIIVSDDGFIGILNTDAKKVSEYLNTLFATFYLNKFHQLRITEGDLNRIEWNGKDEKFLIKKIAFTRRNHIGFERDNPKTAHRLNFFQRKLLTPETLKNTLVRTDEYFLHKQWKELLLLLGEALTLVYEGYAKSSFITGWLIVEQWIAMSWRNFLNKKNFSEKELNVIKKYTDWSVSRYIEVFDKMGKMNETTKAQLDSLRKTRNNIVHHNYEPTKEESLQCIMYAREIMSNFIKDAELKQKTV